MLRLLSATLLVSLLLPLHSLNAESVAEATTVAPAAVTTAAQAATPHLPKPFTAVYKANYSGLGIKATRRLEQLPNGEMKLSFVAKSFIASIEETSRFRWLESGQLQPQQYGYHRTGLSRDRHAELTFDWNKHTVTNDVQNKPWTMDLPEWALDKLSYQLQLRVDLNNQRTDMHYTVADGGKLKTYRFEILGEEVLDTPLGQLNTVKVKRIRNHQKRETLLWLARDWDHLLVRVQQKEKGKSYQIEVAEAKIDGQPITGL